jgi:predicted transcriptional regulator
MAGMKLKIEPHEKADLKAAIKKLEGQTVAVSKIAKEAGINANRARFILEEMLEECTIKREATKAFNANYIRYKYEVIK